MKPLIFAVEDEASIRELYNYTLEGAEMGCRTFENGKELFKSLSSPLPDLILLDIMLPGEDGYLILSKLKENRDTAHIPVIMVSAKGEEISKVKGLNLGADDYIAKPFGVLELIARIKANLRKNQKNEPFNVSYKDIMIDNAKHEVNINGNLVATTLKEFKLLQMLCENTGKVLRREEIFEQVWDSDFVGETRTLDMHIRELRKKLAENKSEAEIQTTRGVGYRLD